MAIRSRPPAKAFGRSLSDYPNLSLAETYFVECCRMGEICVVGDGKRPDKSTKANAIRPGLVRFLALGGDDTAPIHESGVRLFGGYITPSLDLADCQCPKPLALVYCKVDGDISVHGSYLNMLMLTGTELTSLRCDGAVFTGAVYLNKGFKALREVRLLGCKIGSELNCSGGSFEARDSVSICADEAVIAGSVYFNEGFRATAEVRLVGTQVGGVLDCTGAILEPGQFDALCADGAEIGGDALFGDGFLAKGSVLLRHTKIGGDLRFSNAIIKVKNNIAVMATNAVINGDLEFLENFNSLGAAHLVGIKVGGVLHFRDSTITGNDNVAVCMINAVVSGGIIFGRGFMSEGAVNLDSAKSGFLSDVQDANFALGLNGFEYSSFYGDSRTDSASRIAWLNRQSEAHLTYEFKPQPWEQLIKVLRSMGHTADAEDVAIAKQQQLFRGGKITGFNKIWHKLYGLFAGYGYRPTRTMLAMVFVWFFAGLCYEGAGDFGLIGPTSAIIQSNKTIADVCNMPDEMRETQWTACKALPQTYTNFSPYLYSLDLILPLVDLQQDKDWSPIVMKPDAKTIIWAGALIRAVMWFEILFGWLASLLLVAVLGNLVKKD